MLFLNDIKRAFRSYKLYLAIATGMVVFMHPIFSHYHSWAYYSPMQLLSLPLGISDFSPFAVIFCTVPFSESFCEDYISGYGYSIASRIGIFNYSIKRTLTVAIIGAFALSAIISAATVLCFLFSGLPESEETLLFMGNSIWAKEGLLSVNQLPAICLCRIVLFALFGALWSVIGLFVSTIVANKYMTAIIPFILFQLLWYLLGNSIYNPIYYLKANHAGMDSLYQVLSYQVFWIALFSFLAVMGIQKRIRV